MQQARYTTTRAIRTTAAGVALACTLHSYSSNAQVAPSAEALTRGKQLFDAAMADVAREDYQAGCPKFRASYDIHPKASTLLNLGTCFERNGQTASAWGAFSDAVTAAGKVGRSDWAELAQARIAALELRLVRVIIRIAAQPAGSARVRVMRDGVALAESELGLALALDPGKHTLSAEAPGRRSWKTQFEVVEGVDAPLQIVVPALEAAPLPPEKLPEKPTFFTPLRTAGLTIAGVGVLALGTSAAFAIVANVRYATARNVCPVGIACSDPNALASNRSAFDLATVSTVVFVAGAVFAAVGATLIALPTKSGTASPLKPKLALRPAFAVQPDARGNLSADIGLGGAF